VTDDGSPALSDLEAITVTVDPANEMHVDNFSMTAKVKGKSSKSQIFTTIIIGDSDGNAVSGAQVTLNLSDDNNLLDTNMVTTDSNGIAAFTYSSAKAGNTYTATVMDVVKSGWTYNALVNVIIDPITI